jgi:hypothetical protein
MSGSQVQGKVANTVISIKTAVVASMSQLESKPMELTLGLERTISEQRTLPVYPESKHISIGIRNET